MKQKLKTPWCLIGAFALCGMSLDASALAPDQVTAASLATARQLHQHGPVNAIGSATLAAGVQRSTSNASVPGIDSLVNFTGKYQANGVDSNGNPVTQWTYAMVGYSPQSERGVKLRAPVIAVSIDLRDANGNKRSINGKPLYSDGTQYVSPTLKSPIFQNHPYSSSSEPTQFTDAIQRAEFWGHLDDGWHTLLAPYVGHPQVMQFSQDPACGTTNPDGSAGHCNYQFALNADGSCCEFILIDIDVFGNELFPTTIPVTTGTPVGAAELNGDITTRDVSTFLFPNTFLYFGDASQCCVLGYHTFDYEPGDASNGNLPRFYVLNYSSWISPGLFGAGFTDITALSHELSETFNDPFVVFDGVTNLTPWWLSPNGNCQNDLEVGDVVEGLPNATYPITMHGFTYHPQNEALLPWFEFQSPSHAIGAAYSYPDPSVITALSAPQKVNCAP
jgi:hypothetical protein